MNSLLHLVEQYGLTVVFFNVFVEQLGAPLPAYPTLVVTGALLERSSYSTPLLLFIAVLAALIADFMWYLAGRRYGRKVMGTLCRISLSPDSCVRQTESVYLRWGASSLLVAKFIPGFASIASALAGALGTRRTSFIFFDSIGTALWAGSAIRSMNFTSCCSKVRLRPSSMCAPRSLRMKAIFRARWRCQSKT